MADADAAWSALLPRVSHMEESARRIGVNAASLGQPLDGLERDVATAPRACRTDPLSAQSDTATLDRLEESLTRIGLELDEALAIKEAAGERLLITALVDEVESAQSIALETRARLVSRIAGPAPQVADRVADLRHRLAALRDLAAQGRWAATGRKAIGRERDARGTLQKLRETSSIRRSPWGECTEATVALEGKPMSVAAPANEGINADQH